MRATRALLALVLMPLIADSGDQLPKSVRSLVKHPRSGRARLTWADGTHTVGTISRVTGQFVSFCKSAGGGCEDVDFHKIAAVAWLPKDKSQGSGEDLSGPQGYLLLPVLLGAVGVHYVKEPFVSHYSKLGWWKSVQPAPNGSLRWVEFMKPASIFRADALVTPARYRVEDGNLYLTNVTLGGSGAEEVVPISADIARELLRRLSEHRQRDYAPIMIGLKENAQGARAVRGFRPDGTCTAAMDVHSQRGKFEKTKNGLRVRWTHPESSGEVEEWVTRRRGSRLFITRNGDTVEYKRTRPD
jgi:hypothetical protein